MKILRGFIALMCAVPTSVFAFGLPGADPYIPTHVKCLVSEGDIDVMSFGDVLTYHIRGTCKMELLGVKGAWFPEGPYDVVATWRESDGAFHEKLKGPQSIGGNAFEPQHGPWEMELEGRCKLDPFMTGADASSCSGRTISSSNAIFKLSEEAFPVSPRVVPASVRASLTGKTLAAIEAEHQAPKILKPEEGKTYSDGMPLAIDAGKGSPTKTFKLEWQAWLDRDPTKKGVWARALGMPEETGPTGNVPWSAIKDESKWRVRARASQSSKAAWSDWRTFFAGSASPTPAPCSPAGPYGATYGTAATPSSIVAGQTVHVPVKVTNTGSMAWTTAGNFHLSYHWVQNNAPVVYDGQRTTLSQKISACESTTFDAVLIAPPNPGTYTLQWDMVQENVTWFSTQGVPTGNRNVTVSASAAPQPPKK